MTLILFQGHGGRWFMEKIWSKKSRDTVPLNNFFNRRKFRVFKGLSIDIEEEGEGSDRTGCHFLLLNYAAQVYVDIVKGMKAVGFPSWMSASSVELIRHHKPCLLTDNWLICDTYLQIADTVQRHSVPAISEVSFPHWWIEPRTVLWTPRLGESGSRFWTTARKVV